MTYFPNEHGVQEVALVVLEEMAPVVQSDVQEMVQSDVQSEVQEVAAATSICTPKKYVKCCARKLTPKKETNL
jgi:hypothetical protein